MAELLGDSEEFKEFESRLEDLINRGEAVAAMQIASIMLKKVKDLKKGSNKKFKCSHCDGNWTYSSGKEGHHCKKLDVFKSCSYVWFWVDEEKRIRVLKFGLSENASESLRPLSLIPLYLSARRKHSDLNKPHLTDPVDFALDRGENGYICLTYIESGEERARENENKPENVRMTSERSQALSAHAESVSIRDNPGGYPAYNATYNKQSILDERDSPSADHYRTVLERRRMTRNYLQFNRDQFEEVGDLLSQYPHFFSVINRIESGQSLNSDASSFLKKAELYHNKHLTVQLIKKLIDYQSINRTAFQFMPTTTWLNYNEMLSLRQLKAAKTRRQNQANSHNTTITILQSN